MTVEELKDGVDEELLDINFIKDAIDRFIGEIGFKFSIEIISDLKEL